MEVLRDDRGRFVSGFGFHKLRVAIPDSPYELLVFDGAGQLVAPLNEWYRLRKGQGSPRTREAYLAQLGPWLGFLGARGYRWQDEPEAVREFTKEYLIRAGCVVRRDRTTGEGYHVRLQAAATFSPASLALFVAAARDFYRVLIEGEWDPTRRRRVSFYPYANPMYAEALVRWQREHRGRLADAGAPDHAGIRGEARRVGAKQVVGWFRPATDPWEPPVARDAAAIRILIAAAINFTIDHAAPRERVILRLLLETGCRLHEALALTAGGYRAGRARTAGTPAAGAYVVNKGSRGREEKLLRFSPETDAALHAYVRGERARCDPRGRTAIAQLADREPLFLTERGAGLGDGAFRVHWAKLRARAGEHFRAAPVPLPHLHPHLIRHLNATTRFAAIRDAFPGDLEAQRRAQEAVREEMRWRSPETAQRYVHAMSQAELVEQAHAGFVRRLLAQARDLPGAIARIQGEQTPEGPAPAGAPCLGSEAEATLRWLAALQQA